MMVKGTSELSGQSKESAESDSDKSKSRHRSGDVSATSPLSGKGVQLRRAVTRSWGAK